MSVQVFKASRKKTKLFEEAFGKYPEVSSEQLSRIIE